MEQTRRTGLVWHELLMWHDTSSLASVLPAGKGLIEPDLPAESVASKRRIKNLLDVSGLTEQLTPVRPRPATDQELTRVHAPAYIAKLSEMSGKAGGDAQLDAQFGDTPFGPGGFDIARLAAGGVLAAVDAIFAGAIDNAYALVRPPGHHAEAEHGYGFCIFNHGALAARHAMQAHGARRIAIVDWDVHHGNGAEHIFWRDPNVLTISIHQDSAFPPRSGPITANGEGEGAGANLNIPLPPGSGVGAYVAAFERIVLPALVRFRPDFIIVPCGFDAGFYDPLARMMMHSDGFRELTRMVMAAADTHCAGRLLLCHEGGYHTTTVAFYGLAVIEQLSGIRTAIVDPFLAIAKGFTHQDLQPHQDAVLHQAEALVAKIKPVSGNSA
jgi:acetoin utilization deacetylase AcuC-like enzyme